MTPLLASPEAAAHAHPVPLWTTLVFAAVLLGLIGCLAFEEKIHAKKSVIAGAFAVLSLLLGAAFDLLPVGPVVNVFGEALAVPVYVQGVDWSVIAIILGSSVFVDVVSRTGLFTWIALKLTKRSGGDPLKLLWSYGLMTVVFSAVLNNVTAMIIVGSLSAVSLERLGRRDRLLGFLVVEGLLTNVGGLLTLISSVPNIIVGTTAGIGFGAFLAAAAPFVVLATGLTLWMGARLFKVEGLATEAARAAAEAQVAAFDENDGVPSRGGFIFGAVITGLFIGTIAFASVIPWVKALGMGYVALGFAVVVITRHKANPKAFYEAVDWDLIGFFVALFMVINVMEHAQVLGLIGQGLAWMIGLGETLGGGLLLLASAGFSSVTDNIPLAAMLAKILGALGTPSDSPLWWSVIFGANLGGNLTPIGSASTLVAVTIIHKNKLPMSFAGFVKLALPFALMQLALATVYVLLVLR